MALVIIIQLFIIGGFFIIAVAPWFKLFRKAGVPFWLALVPGANAFSFVKMCARPVSYAGLVTFICLPVYWFLYSLFVFQGGDPAALTETILLPLVAFVLSFYLFGFPLLSTTVLFALTYLLSFSPPTPGLMTILTISMIVIACGQAVLDFLNWTAFLTRLHRPLWQLVFIFAPFAVMLALVLVGLLFVPAGIEIVLGALYAALLPGFIFVYYLGFSPKVVYSSDD